MYVTIGIAISIVPIGIQSSLSIDTREEFFKVKLAPMKIFAPTEKLMLMYIILHLPTLLKVGTLEKIWRLGKKLAPWKKSLRLCMYTCPYLGAN
jgi:hypothetical protein